MNKKLNKKQNTERKINQKINQKINKKNTVMKTKNLIYLLLATVAMLVIFLNCSCDREEPDVVAPSAPSGLVASTSTNSVTLSWTASTDNVGVSGYKIFRNGNEVGKSVSTSYTDLNLTPFTAYSYFVKAFDAVGNISKQSQTVEAKTLDDCPTCSKWLVETPTFVSPTNLNVIISGESKSAGTLTLKNADNLNHSANLTLTFSGAGASAVDSLVYKVENTSFRKKVENGVVVLEKVSVPTKGSVAIELTYKIKSPIPNGIADQSQISLALTSLSTDEAEVVQPGSKAFPAIVNLDKIKVYTAQINLSKSYEASAKAEDKILFGNSVAKAFVLEVATPGTIRLEVIGKMNDGSSAIKYFWINDKDDADFYTSVSTLNPIYPKTTFDGKTYVEVSLKAGTNVIAFKANSFSGKIADDSKVGLKVSGSGFSFSNDSYSANSSAANVAARVKVWASWMYNFWIPAKTIGTDFAFSDWRLTPLDENGNYDGNSYPKIENMAVDTRYWTTNYPSLIFTKTADTPLGFGEDFKMLGVIFGNNINEQGFGTIFAKDLANNIVKYENSIIYFSGPAIQTVGNHNYAGMETRVNLYNTGGQEIKTVVRGFDPYPKGWKFTGNPEIELWTHAEQSASVRVQ